MRIQTEVNMLKSMLKSKYGVVFRNEKDAIDYAIHKCEEGYNIHYYTHVNDCLNIMSYIVEYWEV